jgi:hypothetical protein
MLDALPTNDAWWLKASNHSTQRCGFHWATYTDVGMALNSNRLMVSAPLCIIIIQTFQEKVLQTNKVQQKQTACLYLNH